LKPRCDVRNPIANARSARRSPIEGRTRAQRAHVAQATQAQAQQNGRIRLADALVSRDDEAMLTAGGQQSLVCASALAHVRASVVAATGTSCDARICAPSAIKAYACCLVSSTLRTNCTCNPVRTAISWSE